MKKILAILTVALLLVTGVHAQVERVKRADIKTPTAVCEECKAIIEAKAPKFVDGLFKITVQPKRGITQVQFYASRTNIEELKTAIANCGFDADDVTAETEAYKKLPVCCKKPEDGGGPPKKTAPKQ